MLVCECVVCKVYDVDGIVNEYVIYVMFVVYVVHVLCICVVNDV